MSESSAILLRLRAVAQGGGARPVDTRAPGAWLSDGLARAQVHEIHAGDSEAGASAAGFAVALTLAAGALPILCSSAANCNVIAALTLSFPQPFFQWPGRNRQPRLLPSLLMTGCSPASSPP